MSASQAISNTRWTGISQGGRIVIQIVSVAALSRLLPPSDYGLMALAGVVVNFAILFRDMGTSAAIIQRQELSPSLLDAVFWFNLIFGLGVGVFVMLAAPVAAWTFHQPDLTWMLLCLSFAFPIASSSAPLLALLERENSFRQIAWIEISSNVLALAIAIGAALLGAGVFSFVLQNVAAALISSVQLWRASNWRPQLSCQFSELRSIWKYSSNLVAFNFVNYFSRNTDSILIGRFLGVESLGLYNVAYRILIFPLQNLTFVITRALLPVLARKQDDLQEVGRFYLRTLAIIGALSAPMMFGLWALRAPIIEVLMGQKWEGVIPILAWFAPLGFFQSLLSTTGTALAAIGRTDMLRKQGIVSAVLIMGSFVVGMQYGLMGLVIAYSLTIIALTIGIMHYTLTAVRSNLAGLIRVLQAPALCATLMAAAIVIGDHFLAPHTIAIARLAILVPLGAIIYAGLIRIFGKQIFNDLLRFVTRSTPKEELVASPLQDLSNAG